MVRRKTPRAAPSPAAEFCQGDARSRNVRRDDKDRIATRRWAVAVHFVDGAIRWIVDPDRMAIGAQDAAYRWSRREAAAFFVGEMQRAAPSFCKLKVEEL